jgi:DNA processing protein
VISPQTLLSLLNLPGYGKKTVMRSLEYLDSDISTPDELVSFLRNIVGKVKRAKTHTEDTARDSIQLSQRMISDSVDAGIHVIGWGNEGYPERLKTIPDPPLVLYVKGDLTGLTSEKSVALIGTREPSEFGRKSTFAIGKGLAESGVTVVSGLALGCDTEGHLGCLDGNGVTIAVLAHGLDKVFPASNRPLAERILTEGGCLVSEYALGVEARRNHFVERDRLQSGLSDGVIVGETGLEGGSMHTVGFCEKQKRQLACIDHPKKYADLQSTEGNRMLIENEKAFPLVDKDSLKNFLLRLSATRKDDTSDVNGLSNALPKDNQIGISFDTNG